MFKVGQTVWCLLYGKGVVTEIMEESVTSFPVVVEFDKDSEQYASYTLDGKYYSDSNRVLFFSEPTIEAETEPPFASTLIDKNVLLVYKNSDEQYFGTVVQETGNSIAIKTLHRGILYFTKNHVDIYLAELTKVLQ